MVAELVQGVTKISQLRGQSRTVQKAETIRKILLAMARDVRVIIIKLADKLHNMRTLQFLDPERQKADRRGVPGDLQSAGRPAGHVPHQVAVGG